LDTPVPVNFENAPLAEVLEHLQDRIPGTSFRILDTKEQRLSEVPVNLRLKGEHPLGAVLQAIEDSYPGLMRFVIREYGILVADPAQIPQHALSVETFWKADRERWQPAGSLDGYQGEVTAVDAKSNLITISIGSDAGLRKGELLDIFRLKPKPEFLGKVQ